MCVTLVDLTICSSGTSSMFMSVPLPPVWSPSLSISVPEHQSESAMLFIRSQCRQGKKNSLSCNLGGNDLITDKRVFLRAWPCQTAPGAGTTAAAESVSCGAVHRHGAETVKPREPAALRGASCIFSPGLGSLLCSTSTLNATDNSGF